MITACFDFGNSRLKAAIFQNDQLIFDSVLSGDGIKDVQSLLEKYQPEKSILSSVIDHDGAIDSLLLTRTLFHRISTSTKLNFKLEVTKPETVGADRLALCAAAVHYFPDNNNLIIAMGSCITYNFINQYHQFLGGGISPGMDMRFQAMQHFTSKLPLVTAEPDKIGWNFPLIGYDTKTNMQSGVINGILGEIDGSIEKYASKYGNFNVLLTGGNSAYFAGELKSKIFADPNFLFKGLYVLSETNNRAA